MSLLWYIPQFLLIVNIIVSCFIADIDGIRKGLEDSFTSFELILGLEYG